jgi:hypothetical protein
MLGRISGSRTASSQFLNPIIPLFQHSTIPNWSYMHFLRRCYFDKLTRYYISVMMMAFDLHTAVQVKHPRQFCGLMGIALCGISNTSVGHIFRHSSQESHLSGST